MSEPEARRWNQRYLQEPNVWGRKLPHQLVIRHMELLTQPGLALDVACGTAASGLYLARRGWKVIGLDAAAAALRLAQARARKEKLELPLAVMDVADLWLPEERFDLVLNLYFLERSLWPLYRRTLKPGGLLFFETFVWQAGEGSRREFFLEPGELRQAFADWQVLHYGERLRRRDAGDKRIVASLIARKAAVSSDEEIASPLRGSQ
jgi:SAM-dependent methyltransferase